ncbi:MAG: galactosyldiacylglycerol synthase [Meiothermus sp.]|nr:galactosyldiacylglycerol synthase [Meiothermus sp.]
MPQLFNADTGAHIGEISESQLEFLSAQMEEESAEDQDYYLNADLLETWRESGADPALLELLVRAMGGAEDLSVKWSR